MYDNSIPYASCRVQECERSIPIQDESVCNDAIKNKKTLTIKEMMDEQSAIIRDVRSIVDSLVSNIDLSCTEQLIGDNNKMEIRDLNTAILSNSEALCLIRSKLAYLSEKIG